MPIGKKKRWKARVLLFGTVMILCVSLLSLIVYTQVPTPHTVRGKVLTNSSNGVQNGIPVLINNTVNGNVVYTEVSAPPAPPRRGEYSADVNGTTGDFIVLWSWNNTHFGNNTAILAASTTFANITLNYSRSSEANVTIMQVANHTVKNKTIDFNITANVSMIAATGTNCNATVIFTDEYVLNMSPGLPFYVELTSIPLGSHSIVNFTVRGKEIGRVNVTVRVDCESDLRRFDNTYKKSIRNITIQNIAPNVTATSTSESVILNPGINTTLYCNATISDGNSGLDIMVVNATLFQTVFGYYAADDRNSHYTNNSCINLSSSLKTEINYSCGFSVAYFANNGSWTCNMTIVDYSNATLFNKTNSRFEETLAIEILPNVVDYGNLFVGQTSPDDVNVSIFNIGNVPFNVTVDAYARNDGDNYSMKCETGNFTLVQEHYAVVPSTPFDIMFNVSDTSTVIPNFTMQQRTNDLNYGNDSNTTYWKIQVPPLVRGQCNGSLVFKTRIL